jgi:hypothetical protein
MNEMLAQSLIALGLFAILSIAVFVFVFKYLKPQAID